MNVVRLKSVKFALAALGLGAILGVATGASAAQVANRATGLASPIVTIGFGSGFLFLPEGTIVTNQFAAAGVTFGTGYEYESSTDTLPSVAGGFCWRPKAVPRPVRLNLPRM